MIAQSTNINTIWCDLMVAEFVRLGVRCFALSSGARSGVIAAALARHPEVEPVIHFDERASAFFALGHARATGTPAVWITTSGTAAANGYPALIEAAQDDVPLIAWTADRPPELRAAGANQTILQTRLFGDYPRWQVDLPCPDTAISPRYVLATVDQAFARACGPLPGPVHLNHMMREPLTPDPDGTDYTAYMQPVARWLADRKMPYTRIATSPAVPYHATVDEWVTLLESARNGVLIVGRLARQSEKMAAFEIAQQLDFPVLADIGSGLRLDHTLAQLVPYADQVLLAEAAAFQPDLIVHIGGPIVSKRVQEWIENAAAEYVVIKSHTRRQDPAGRAARVLECDLPSLARRLSGPLVARPPAEQMREWREASNRAAAVLQRHLEADAALDEIYVAVSVASLCPAAGALFVGNSMPIRDLDMYARPRHAPPVIAANRGASGIDGSLATACGWAHGLGKPVLALLGDLACLHDLNALRYVQQSRHPVILVVLNNNGGGIFSFLPIAAHADFFEPYFGTPHDLQFADAARMFGLSYEQPQTRAAFDDAVKAACASGSHTLIEVRTKRAENADLHRTLQKKIQNERGGGKP
jgi:2-succinyl-5-enolpyruvyl-6-hydroxy-3-cyclohexene-1-carboxylate synthase